MEDAGSERAPLEAGGKRRKVSDSSEPPPDAGSEGQISSLRHGRGLGHDHISELPDDVLARILSLLRDMGEAVRTSILSRRWRHLWKYTRSLHFRSSPDKDESNFPNFVSKALDLHRGTHLDSFGVWFNYKDEDAHQVDSWIHHVVTHNVHDLCLNFGVPDTRRRVSGRKLFELRVRHRKPYELPPCFSSIASSLEILRLVSCNKLEIPPSSRFNFLRTVFLYSVGLGDNAIKNLTSTSPCLQSLILKNCTWVAAIHIENPKLRTVRIDTEDDGAGDIIISAPNLKRLILRGRILMRRYHIEHLPSTAVLLNFDEMFNMQYNNTDGDRLIELLGCLRHASELHLLGTWCIQVLALRAVIGRIQWLQNPILNAVELSLETNLRAWELPGIVYLLKSCHQIQKLTINIGSCEEYKLNVNFIGNYHVNEREYWKVQEMSSSCVIENLKIVKITGCMKCACPCTEEKENDVTEEESVKIKTEISFIKFLLKNSVALEKMTIRGARNRNFSQLFVFPKASPNAEIILK